MYNGKWIDLHGYYDKDAALEICKRFRQKTNRYIYQVVKVSYEVLPLP